MKKPLNKFPSLFQDVVSSCATQKAQNVGVEENVSAN